MTIEDVRQAKTSDLLALFNPDVMIKALGDTEATHEQIDALYRAIAAEIDRRIPVPA